MARTLSLLLLATPALATDIASPTCFGDFDVRYDCRDSRVIKIVLDGVVSQSSQPATVQQGKPAEDTSGVRCFKANRVPTRCDDPERKEIYAAGESVEVVAPMPRDEKVDVTAKAPQAKPQPKPLPQPPPPQPKRHAGPAEGPYWGIGVATGVNVIANGYSRDDYKPGAILTDRIDLNGTASLLGVTVKAGSEVFDIMTSKDAGGYGYEIHGAHLILENDFGSPKTGLRIAGGFGERKTEPGQPGVRYFNYGAEYGGDIGRHIDFTAAALLNHVPSPTNPAPGSTSRSSVGLEFRAKLTIFLKRSPRYDLDNHDCIFEKDPEKKARICAKIEERRRRKAQK